MKYLKQLKNKKLNKDNSLFFYNVYYFSSSQFVALKSVLINVVWVLNLRSQIVTSGFHHPPSLPNSNSFNIN